MTKIYKGVHGTCRAWGQQIRQDGFSQSLGRLGFGAYFWRYYDRDDYAKFLAFKWWQFKDKKGDYNSLKVKDKKCALLNCSFHINQSTEVLDFTNGLEKETLIGFIKDRIHKMKTEEADLNIDLDKIITGLLQVYIKKMEQKQNSMIKIVIFDLASPKGSGGALGKLFGASAEAIFVRDPACIYLENIENVDYYEHV